MLAVYHSNGNKELQNHLDCVTKLKAKSISIDFDKNWDTAKLNHLYCINCSEAY